MSKIIGVVIEADKGTTVQSPNFFSLEESTEGYETLDDIEQALLSGELTPVNPNLYTYQGMVKEDYNQPAVVTLDIQIDTVVIDGTTTNGGVNRYDVVKFKIEPTQTNTWANKQHTLLFDIKRTLATDPSEVDIWVRGTIEVSPTVTG